MIAGRSNRKWVMAAFTGFWGIWTIGCGLAGGFRQLLVACIIACLEFGCFIPLTISLAKDVFDENQSEMQYLRPGRPTGSKINSLFSRQALKLFPRHENSALGKEPPARVNNPRIL